MYGTLASFPGLKRRPGNEARWEQWSFGSSYVSCVPQSDYCEVSGCGSGPSQEVFKHMLTPTWFSVRGNCFMLANNESVLCKKWSHPRRACPTRQVDMVWAPSQEVIRDCNHITWPTRFSVCFLSANNEGISTCMAALSRSKMRVYVHMCAVEWPPRKHWHTQNLRILVLNNRTWGYYYLYEHKHQHCLLVETNTPVISLHGGQ